ncbi:hypothetical protein F4823DRAFT_231833 [Ustulina deusta]|nr:hypothetical protein F4823DRAFT_231833 [Ustulina deusta]
MVGLQRDGRGGPTTEGWLRCAVDGAGTVGSTACVELEPWPSQPSISRRTPLSSSSSSAADRHADESHHDQCESAASGETRQNKSVRIRPDTPSPPPHQHRFNNSKTIPPVRSLRRADPSDSIASSATTFSPVPAVPTTRASELVTLSRAPLHELA